MNQTIIDVPGNLCSKESCDELASQIQAVSRDIGSEIVLQFRKVDAVSAYAIRTIVAGQQECIKHEGRLVIEGVSGVVAGVLRAIRFDRVVPVRS